MKLISAVLIGVVVLSSCSANRTVYISNKTGNTITLLVDSSYINTHSVAFTNSLHGLRVTDKKVLDYGKGKWTKDDKSALKEVLKHTMILIDSSKTATAMPGKTSVSHIHLDVEELWVNIK